jgi:hypothetical protein
MPSRPAANRGTRCDEDSFTSSSVRASRFGNVRLTILGLELKSIGRWEEDSHEGTRHRERNARNVGRMVRRFLELISSAESFAEEIAKVLWEPVAP